MRAPLSPQMLDRDDDAQRQVQLWRPVCQEATDLPFHRQHPSSQSGTRSRNLAASALASAAACGIISGALIPRPMATSARGGLR